MSEQPGEPRDLAESDPNGGGPNELAGAMGVSSERTGAVRGTPGEHTHGTEDTAEDQDPQPD